MSSISVKSYLFPENLKVHVGSLSKSDEIRRFNLPLNNGDNIYQVLLDKIRSVYGSVLSQNGEVELKTYWLDEENELIGFSSDSEMQYAIDTQNAIRASQVKPSLALFKVYIGQERKKETPLKSEPKSSAQESQIHFGVVCDGCSGSIFGTRRKCVECPDYDLCEKCHEKGLHKESGHSFIVFDKPVKRRCPYMNNGPHRRGGYKHCKQQQQQKCGENSGATPFQEMLSNLGPFISSSVPRVSNPEHLKTVGEFLRSILDPFGIDCDFKVETKNKETEKKVDESDKAKTSSDTEKKEEEKKMETEEDDDDENAGIRVFASSEIEEPAKEPSAPVKETSEPKQESPFEAAANALKEAIKNTKETDEAKQSTSSPSQTRRTSDANLDDFNLVDFQKEIQIINAIDQLRAMGYSDDDGWLTRLATAKQGNINAVLDAIMNSK